MDQQQNKNNVFQYLPFEKTIAELDRKVEELNKQARAEKKDNSAQIRKIQKQQTAELKEIYSSLTPWQTVQVSRHPQRPLFSDYLNLMVKNPIQLHGDRCFGDDLAIKTYFGQIAREKVMIIGQDKGREMKDKIACNFGCPNPEGYRKALAKMKIAEKFHIPVVTIIDTPGAYPGIGAEERGQAQAIAVNLMEMSRLKVPVICVVIGEGGSGGALGIGVGDKFAILQHAYYSVISPEGCAAILWRDGAMTEQASNALKLTASELAKLNLVDSVIAEPLGGAHRNIHDTVYNVEQFITRSLKELKRLPIEKILEKRYQRLRNYGNAFQKPFAVPQRQTEKHELPEKVSVQAQLEKVRQQEQAEQTAGDLVNERA